MADATRYSLDQIQHFWTSQAVEHGTSHAASWSDVGAIELEIKEISQRLRDGQRVLDIGCANGYSTFHWAAQRKVDVLGLDYIPEMIVHAKARLSELRQTLVGRTEFDVGDITALKQADASFDAVVVIRVVINLGDWPLQRQALLECARVLKPGGMLLASEATVQGWRRLNKLRNEWGLPDIPMPAFNQYLDEDRVVEALAEQMELVEIANFASSYFVGTRLIKPLLARMAPREVDVADPNMEFNRWMTQWPAIGDYGTQKLFVFRKR